jgi:PAS domain S-box-containing protein
MMANAPFWGAALDAPNANARGGSVLSSHSAPTPTSRSFATPEPRAHEAGHAQLRLETVLQTAADAIILHDAEGKVTFWNAAAAREWGWSAREAIGKAVGPLLFIDQDHYNKIHRALTSAKQWQGHVATMSKCGKLVVRHASVSQWENGAAAPGVLISCRTAGALDIDCGSVLRIGRLEAFAEIVAKRVHELNNALSPIVMTVDLIRSRIDAPGEQALLSALDHAAAWAARITTDLQADLQEANQPLPFHREHHESEAEGPSGR